MSGSVCSFLRSPRQWLAHRRAHRSALAAWERAKRPKPTRDPLWADFQDASLRADGERLADIGDWVLAGVPIDLFNLGKHERGVVEAYCGVEPTA